MLTFLADDGRALRRAVRGRRLLQAPRRISAERFRRALEEGSQRWDARADQAELELEVAPEEDPS